MTTELSVSRVRIKTSKHKTVELGEHSVHDRQEQVPGWDQSKIESSAVGCIGEGGLGGKFTQNSARIGVGRLEFCDGDVVELPNLNRQFFYYDQIFKNKALSVAENLKRECTGDTIIDAYALYFQEARKKYPGSFQGLDVIGCFVDDEETRFEVSRFGIEHKIPIIFSTVSRTTRYGEVIVQDVNGPCLDCIKPRSLGDAVEDARCREPTVIYIHTAVMGIAVYAAVSILLNWKMDWNYYGLSLNSESIVAKCPQRNECDVCLGVS